MHAPQRGRAEPGSSRSVETPFLPARARLSNAEVNAVAAQRWGRSHHRWCWKKRRCGPVMAMTSMAQDLQGQRQKAHPSFSLESCLLAPLRGLPACRGAAPPSISPCLIFVARHLATAKHAVLPSRARAFVVSARPICRSSAPPATASQDTYRAAAIALSKNRQTAFSSGLIDTAPFSCPPRARPCISPPLRSVRVAAALLVPSYF